MIRIATWNVNSIKARLVNLERWLKETTPDIVLLQELKCIDEAFPRAEIEALDYNIARGGPQGTGPLTGTGPERTAAPRGRESSGAFVVR
jgi:exonuclease III